MADLLEFKANESPLNINVSQISRAPKARSTDVAASKVAPVNDKWTHVVKGITDGFRIASAVATGVREDMENSFKEKVDDAFLKYNADMATDKAVINNGRNAESPEAYDEATLNQTAQNRLNKSLKMQNELADSVDETSGFSTQRQKYIKQVWGSTITNNTREYTKVQIDEATQTIERRYLKSFTTTLMASTKEDGDSLDLSTLIKEFSNNENNQEFFKLTNASEADKLDAFYSIMGTAVGSISDNIQGIGKMEKSLEATLAKEEGEVSPQFLKLLQQVNIKNKALKTSEKTALKKELNLYLADQSNNDVYHKGKPNPNSKYMAKLLQYHDGKTLSFMDARKRVLATAHDNYVVKSGLAVINSGGKINLSDFSGEIKTTFKKALRKQYTNDLINGKISNIKISDPDNAAVLKGVIEDTVLKIHSSIDVSDTASVREGLMQQQQVINQIKLYPNLMSDSLKKDASVYSAILKYGKGNESGLYQTYLTNKANDVDIQLSSSEHKEINDFTLGAVETKEAKNTFKLLKSLGIDNADDIIEDHYKPREVGGVKISSDFKSNIDDDALEATLKSYTKDIDYGDTRLILTNNQPQLQYVKDGQVQIMTLPGFAEEYNKQTLLNSQADTRDAGIEAGVTKLLKPVKTGFDAFVALKLAPVKPAADVVDAAIDYTSDAISGAWGSVTETVDETTTNIGDYLIEKGRE